MKRYLAYLMYVLKHKYYVFTVGWKMRLPLWNCITHDLSKLRPSEFFPYARCFYLKNGTPRTSDFPDIRWAWLCHQKRNKHHWQYWVLFNDNSTIEVLHMKFPYAREMVVDLIASGKSIPNGKSAGDYYLSIRDNIIMHADTKAVVEDLLVHYGGLSRHHTAWPNVGNRVE